MGHVPFSLSHSSMQSAWKQWSQSGMVLRVSMGWNSERHMAHVTSSGLGSLRLSPSTTFGYDSMVSPSRPETAPVRGVMAVEASSTMGWLCPVAKDLTRPQTQQINPVRNMSPGTPTPNVIAYRATRGISAII